MAYSLKNVLSEINDHFLVVRAKIKDNASAFIWGGG